MHHQPTREAGGRSAAGLEHLEPRLLLFGTAPHHEITATALSFINDSVLTTINAQHEWQDKHDPNGSIAAYHFDGCYFNEGAIAINSRYQTMLSNANPTNFGVTAIATEFGRTLHALQDFYSHSNWVEAGQTALVEPGVGLWDTFAPYSIHNGVMLIEGESQTPTVSPYGTARFSRNGHVVTVSFAGGISFPGIISGNWVQEKSPDNIEVSHDYLNKDYSTRAGFQPAHDLALQQTRHEFQRLGALIKNQYGDTGVNMLLATWVKPDQASQDAARALLDLPPGGGGGTSQPVTIINSGDTWKYLDNGTDQGSTWRGGGFDDSSWKNGNAELGYGDGDEATVVSFGTSSSNKYITTYFRKTFSIADPSQITALTLSLVRDDGAIVYLNGTEVFRSNMPSGTLGYQTRASSAIEDANWKSTSVSPSLLVSGSNVFSVEIHQAGAGSSDISFNLKLDGAWPRARCRPPSRRPRPPPPH